ncbi:MAG: peptidoglycan-binding domain-containing protein, partial [Candidatus Paceibacterota bacterium]
MHIPLINNDMKDINQSFKISNVTVKVLAFPLVALLAILGSVFISDGPVLANESAEMTRIAADIDESYFISEDNDRLAQAGKIESRSSGEVSADESSETAENTETAGQCQSLYLEDHLRIDFDNDPEEVLRLQSFLKTYEGYDYVSLSGTFDESTLRAVEAFQTRYAGDILTPWGYQADEATGYVYITTKQKINEIYCDEQFMLNREQQAEILAYREKLNQWRAQGASFETPQYLATYYGYGRGGSEGTLTYSDTNELEPRESAGDSDEAATSATSTDEDSRGFFARLFGIGNDDEATST